MWDTHLGPTLLISTLATMGNPHAKLQLRSKGCSVAKSFALVLLGAAFFFLRTGPVKSQGSSPKCGWGQLLLWMGNCTDGCAEQLRKCGLSNLAKSREATRREQEENQSG